ncbi:MAG: alpha-2-macroglobulin family protein [Verrucomicrobiae bacterium]|nr:alpha-2-macroglobulin family protein [Verrucomicrobiae bacterium]
MKRIFFFLMGLACLVQILPAAPGDYEKRKEEAEKLFAEKSYAQAAAIYAGMDMGGLAPEERRWVKFRQADAAWRAQAGTQAGGDDTVIVKARQQLEAMVRDVRREEEKDRVYAEVCESLGDYFWKRRNVNDWGTAWPCYERALDWWAGARDIEMARDRYLGIVWRMTRRERPYSWYGQMVPLPVLENVLRIAKKEGDLAWAHYLMGTTLSRQGGDWLLRRRVAEEFEAAIKPGKGNDWYDDALYHYAEFLHRQGRVVFQENGGMTMEPDYARALELYRRLVTEFKKGETSYFDQAKQAIDEITKPMVQVQVSEYFIPDCEVSFLLNWRNVKKIDFSLYKTDLTRDVTFSGKEEGFQQWIQKAAVGEAVKSWSKATDDRGDHKPGREESRMDGKLQPGSYLLEARAGGQVSRALVMVTDAALVLKTTGKQALVYFCRSEDGAPMAGAEVAVWERSYDKDWQWHKLTGKTNDDGLAVFDLKSGHSGAQVLAMAGLNDRQAFAEGHGNHCGGRDAQWRIYVFTDRPAYRPKEEVKWKMVVRRYDGSVYSTPADQTVLYEIRDPRGGKLKEGNAKLNAFGSAWGTLELPETLPLGEYKIEFREGRKNDYIGSAALFRLEEYKLPEFKVSVQMPEENGKKKTFRSGDRVEVNIQADYYFGGPVANASVEVIVKQKPFYHGYTPAREYPWFYQGMNESWQRRRYYGEGGVMKREVVRTDATGKAVFVFDSHRNTNQDYEYAVEARMTDSSRREITGRGTVRVTRQRYYVYPQPEHNIYRPKDQVKIHVKAMDANEQPVQTEGTIRVVRNAWNEVWIDPEGREVKGDEIRGLREKQSVFPPPYQPGVKNWRLKKSGYESEEIVTRKVKTDEKGELEWTFEPDRVGYYRVCWMSRDKDGAPIRGDTAVWVTHRDCAELDYRHQGVEIIVDKDTFRVGQKAPVMINARAGGRYVLFSVEGQDLYNHQLVRMSGTTKLLEVPVEEKHVPNVLLSAVMVSGDQMYADAKPVVVPPVDHFLKVEVKPDRGQYRPREEGTLRVTVKDCDDKPVAAEVAMGLADESVYYIQQDLAGDPRQFFYGGSRPHLVQTQSTFNSRRCRRWVTPPAEGEVDGMGGGYIARRSKEMGFKDQLFCEKIEEVALYQKGFSYNKPRVVTSGVMAAAPVSASFAAGGRMDMDGFAVAEEYNKKQGEKGGENVQEPAVQVRSDFRATVFWQPDVMTDKDGTATVKVKYPDSMTTWKAIARAATAGNQFGMGQGSSRTKQPLIVRLQAPRFFVAGDTVTVSAVINNNTDRELTVRPQLDVTGMAPPADARAATVKAPANGEARVDWILKPSRAGVAKLKVTARADACADAMEKSYEIHEHGIEKFAVKAGKVRGESALIKLEIPRERRKETTRLQVQISPSLAVTMLDALPYLVDYPYGCTEQTMSRFLPVVIVSNTLRDMKLDPEDVMGRVFGGIEAQHAVKTQPKGKKNLAQLDDMTKKGLARLYDFQHADGGWGWWKGGDSDRFMTAYVVWGMTLARAAGVDIRQDAVARAAGYLDRELVSEEANLDMQAWMLHALAVDHAAAKRKEVGRFQTRAFENLWTNREQLNAYARALLALSAQAYGYEDKAKILAANLENGVKLDDKPDVSVIQDGKQESAGTVMGTAHWGEEGVFHRWSEGGVESTAWVLRALLAIDPQHKLVEPAMNWLVKNRRGAQWSNTRDTAMAVLALNDYLKKSGETGSTGEYELRVNGRTLAKRKFSLEDVLGAPSVFVVEDRDVRDGVNEIRLTRRGGTGSIYFSVQAAYFSLEEPVTPSGNEIFARRQYFKLSGRSTLLKGQVYERLPLNDQDEVQSGDRVETVITIEVKNNYEYLVFEDLKPAGFEAVELQSGGDARVRELKSGTVERRFGKKRPADSDENQDYTGRQRYVHQELRDRKVACFIDKLAQGVWEIRYTLRAETPGRFHALPVMGHAMYVPEIRCNSAETRVVVKDAGR